MRRSMQLVCTAMGLLVLGLTLPGHAQAQSWEKEPIVPPPVYVVIDDQIFDVAGDTATSGPSGIRPQGATVDSNSSTWSLKYNGWEASVLPIEFADEVTASRRDLFMTACNSTWGNGTLILCVPRTSQMGYLRVTSFDNEPGHASPCYSAVGQARRLVEYKLNLGAACWSTRNIHHELGHALGFVHEHQRPDRDTYVSIDTANVRSDALDNFTRVTSLVDRLSTYDFLSVMHYPANSFAIDTSRPTIIPRSGYASYSSSLGTASTPSTLDREALYNLVTNYYRPIPSVVATPTQRFNRTDFLDAMERLDAYYYSRIGLNRSAGLSINGKPDFQGIATWIFDVYLAARSAGLSSDMSFGVVVADITQSAEWRGKHPTWTPGTRGSIRASVSFDRNEFLDALQRLDAFYAAPEGLRRPNGLSILGGPDFLGIATWMFDVYLNSRLSGASATVSWTRVVDAIRATDEWRSKH